MKLLVQRSDAGRNLLVGFAAALALWLVSAISSPALTLAEGLDTTNLVWTTGGDAVWFAQTTNTYDDIDAVRSGNIGSNQTSWIETTVIGPATVASWSYFSYGSESYTLFLTFSINGSMPLPGPRFFPAGWTEEIHDLGAGTNVLRWTATATYGNPSDSFVVIDQFRALPPRPLGITWQPSERTVYSGAPASFSVAAIGTPPLFYQWLKDGTAVSAATNNWLQINVVSSNDGGAYSVIVSNSQGFVVSSNAILTVLPPSPPIITYGPESQTAYSGENSYLSAWVEGSPPFAYQWSKNGTTITGATNSGLYLGVVTTNDSGNYSVVVSNSLGSVTSSNAILTVLAPSPPFFTYQPASAAAYAGTTVYLSGSVDGSPPFLFQWRKDGTNMTALSAPPWGSYGSLTLTNITAADAGSYSLFVTNDYGNVESSNAVLTVLPSVAPVITKHPRSLAVAAGVNTWLSAGASGDPTPFYTWSRRGDPPPQPPTGPQPPVIGGAPRTNRAFNNVSFTNAGVYSVTATNYAGSTTSREALLTVLPPITNLSSWWQGAQDISVNNGLAYLAQGSIGLGILSVSNPAAPVLLGGYNTPGSAAAVVVDGGRVYVADGSAGLQIFSVTNSVNPVRLGGYDTPYSVSDLAVRSNLVFLADGKTGLLIVNVSNPAAPSLVGSFHSNFSAEYVRVAGNFAYVSSRYSEMLPGTNVAGFFAINVADPAHPFEVGRLPFSVGKFEVRNQTVFAVTGTDLEVISITNPAQPVVIGSFHSYVRTNWPPGSSSILASDVQVLNDLVIVGGCQSSSSGSESRLYVLDVRDPSEPIPVGYYTNATPCYSLCVDSNLVYFTGMDGVLDIIQTPFNPAPILPPTLKLSASPALQLELHGRRGRNYDVETAPAPGGVPWQVSQTLLLTNDTVALPITPTAAAQFYRLRQLD